MKSKRKKTGPWRTLVSKIQRERRWEGSKRPEGNQEHVLEKEKSTETEDIVRMPDTALSWKKSTEKCPLEPSNRSLTDDDLFQEEQFWQGGEGQFRNHHRMGRGECKASHQGIFSRNRPVKESRWWSWRKFCQKGIILSIFKICWERLRTEETLKMQKRKVARR